MDDEKLFEEFYQRLKIGLPGVESSNGDYSAQNKQGSAAGKYQFTEQWLDEKKYGKDSITAFARDSKVFEVPKTMDEFKSNPDLQEAYFKHYTKNVLYPKAKTLIKSNNPLDLSMDQVGALIHFQGETAAKTQVVTGKLPSSTKKGVKGAKYDNISGAGYLNKYTKTLKGNALEPISKNLTADDKKKQAIVKDFQEREKAINDLDIEQWRKEKLRANLYKEVTNAGNKSIINEHIRSENDKNKIEHDNKIKEYQELKNLAEKIDINFIKKQNNGKFENELKPYSFFKLWRDSDVTQRNKLAKKYPDMFIGKSGYESHLDPKKLFSKIEGLHKDLTGEEVNIDLKNLKSDGFHVSTTGDRTGSISLNNLKLTDSIPQDRLPIPDDIVQDSIIPENISEEKEENSKSTSPDSTTKTETPKEKEVTEDTDDLAEQFFNTELGLTSLNNDNFNYEPGKRELPIDAITGMALGLIGNKQAKEAKIPLRTEEVSEAMKNYVAELSERSKNGLPVEVEAQMKGLLADAYQGGLANIVNASNGNSATVLGNLGSLEQAKNKGLVAAQIADYEAKDRAFAQYGQAIQYINEFDARRDIANHEIGYTEAKQKQQEGKQLATAGFAKLIDGLKYQRENGPGSANDMYRSMLMQKMFGFDPKMNDDGTGEKVGTKSWYDKNNALTQKDLETTKELHRKYGSLNPDQKKVFNKVIGETKDKEKLGGLIDYMNQNPDIDASKIGVENLDLALEKNDFGLLSKNRKEILNPTQSVLPQEGLGLASTLPTIDNQKGTRLEGLNQSASSELESNGLVLPEFGLTSNLTLNR